MLSRFFVSFFATVFDVAPWMVLGFFVAGFVNVFVSKPFLTRWLGGNGFGAMVRSILVGLGLPICSCGVVPIGIGLHRRGASVGSTLSFMVSTPAMSPAAALVLWTMLGPRLAASYVGSVVVTSLAIGVVSNRLFPKPPEAQTCERADDEGSARSFLATKPSVREVRRMFDWALHDYGAEVSFDILFGLFLASAALALVPREWIVSAVGTSQLMTYVVIAAIAAPLYVCTLPSIPVVRNLVALGMVPGAAVTYLLAGTATNYGEIRAIGRQMSRKVAWFFLAFMIVASIACGLLVDRFVFHVGTDGPSAARAFVPVLLRGEDESLSSLSLAQLAWRGVGTALLAYALLAGAWQHARKLFANPCQVCTFWSRQFEIREFKGCSAPCWLLRTVNATKRVPLVRLRLRRSD